MYRCSSTVDAFIRRLFLPFNLGDNGGKGNPPNPAGGHRTAYLWERVWERESWLEILGRYLTTQRDKKKQIEKIIFPRFHQLDVTRKLQAAVLADAARSLEVEQRVLELGVDDVAIRNDEHRVEDLLVLRVVELGEEVRCPGNGVGLARTRRVCCTRYLPPGPSAATAACSFLVTSSWWKRGKMIVSSCFFLSRCPMR